MPVIARQSLAELIGTFWLVFGGVGSAVYAAGFPNVGIGLVGVSLAFGLTVMTMAYAIGHISGCHLNPAVTLGLIAGGRADAKVAAPYIIAQCIGGVIAGALLVFILTGGTAGADLTGASNGFGEHSPWASTKEVVEGETAVGYSMAAVIVAEFVLTAMFLFVIMGATDRRAPGMLAPVAIGLCLTLIHLISIPISNTSVNPARSLGTAVFSDGWALSQLWVFIVAPIAGGIVGGGLYRAIMEPALTDEPEVAAAA